MPPTTSPLTEHLHEYLHEEPSAAPAANLATVLKQGERAQDFLWEKYLGAWLDVIGGLPQAGYSRANRKGFAQRLERLGKTAAELREERTKTEAVFFLESLRFLLSGACAEVNRADERSMQWGLWARDVPMSIAYGFSESAVLDPLICEGIAPCCMYAAYLTSMIVEDEGVAEEIEYRFFEQLPRELLTLVRETPAAPEA